MNPKQHDAALVALMMEFRERCAKMAEGYIYGNAAARAIRTIGVEEVQRLLSASAQPAHLLRRGLESTPAMVRAERDRAMDLVRRASARIRELHEELARAEAELAMAADPAPLDEIHGTTAANAGKVQAAA